VKAFVVAVVLLAQAQTPNLWDGTWTWGTYEERIAFGEAFIAQSAAVAKEHCGEQYFGTICR
jgi:hypothetical protein